jgi:cytochrome c-type biogenesis protein
VGDVVLQWYGFLTGLTQAIGLPLRDLAESIGWPPLTALLLGLIGSLAPCQLSTGLGAIALIGRREEGRPFLAGLAYAAGKATLYAMLGLAFVLAGHAVEQGSIPLIQIVRRALGPLMLLVGLVLIGALRARGGFAPGERLAAAAADRFDATRPRGAFALGAAFGLAFCPTLFFLFFGLLVPLALVSAGGVVYPVLFAVGTVVPVLVVLGAITLGLRGAASLRALGSIQRPLTRLAGIVLVLAGINDTVVYWFI